MGDLRLIRPEIKHKEQAEKLLDEFYTNQAKLRGSNGLWQFRDDYAGWLERLRQDRQREPNELRVPSETFFFVRQIQHSLCGWPEVNDQLIGVVSIRSPLSNALWLNGGNISLSIRPSERKHGYAEVCLFLALKHCWQCLSLTAVLVDYSKCDIASLRLVSALGGKVIREHLHRVTSKKFITIQQCTIDVGASIHEYSAQYVPLTTDYLDWDQ